MRSFLVLALWFILSLWSILPMTAHAGTFVYVSKSPEQEIAVFELDAKDGSLRPVETVAVKGSPGSLAVDRRRTFLFASLRSTSTLASFRIDRKSGKLTLIGSVPLGEGENAAFVGTDRTGRWLLSASYGAGKVVVHRVREDGTIESPAVQTVETAKTAHCVAMSPDNRFAFVPHVEPNAVYQFRFDATTGKLTDAGRAAGGTENAGPRHLAFYPKRKVAFTSDESGSSITSYGYDAESGLKPLQTLSTLPADYKETNSTAEVRVHPNGRFVWVSNRGHDSLAGFAIDDAGKLSPIERTPTEKTPRSFDIAPSGRYVFSAGEGSGKLAVFRCDPETGKLTRLHTVEVGKSLSWVMAVELE